MFGVSVLLFINRKARVALQAIFKSTISVIVLVVGGAGVHDAN